MLSLGRYWAVLAASMLTVLFVGAQLTQAGTTGGLPTQTTFQQDLQLYDTGPEVLTLQETLNSDGFLVASAGSGSPGKETQFFGHRTYNALVRYQSAHGLPSTGYFGPITRAAISRQPNGSATQGHTNTPTSIAQQITSPTNTASATTSRQVLPLPASNEALSFGGGGEGGGVNTNPPTISGTPSNMSVSATSPAGASVTYTNPSASDPTGGTDVVSCSPVSGTTFPLGTSNVTCTTTDSAGISSHSSFTVTVTETSSPSVSISTPSNGATVSGTTIPLTAVASDTVAVQNVQFKVGTTNIGAAITSAPYSTTWNSKGVSDGSYTLYAIAENTAGYYATSSVTVLVRNSPPVISAITANSIASTTETITWTTDEPATSTVSYGLTTGYGVASSSAVFTTSHSITLTGLSASTTYDFELSSADSQGNLATSSNQSFTTAAYNYYVDSVNGSDSNAGTSPALAFQNITALPTIQAGQSVALADGSHWRQQLTINASNVTVTNYGSGALPILDASDIISNASFTKTTGYTNVYNTATTTFTEGGSIAWANMWETGGPGDSSTGTFLANESSMSAVDSTACSYYIPTMTTSFMPNAEPIYIHSCDGTNPVTNAYTYEVAQRTGLLMTSFDGKVYNVAAEKSADNNGVFDLEGDGNSYTVSGVVARDGGKHNLFAAGGSTVENSTFIDGYYPAAGGANTMLVFYDNIGSGLPITAIGNVFQNDQNTSGNGTNSAFLSHTGTSGSLGNVTLENNWYIGKNGAPFDIGQFNNAGSLSASGEYGSQLLTGYNTVQPATINNVQFVSSVSGNIFVYMTTAGNLTIENSSACESNLGGSQGMVFLNTSSGSLTLTLTDNKFYLQTPTSGNVTIWDHGTATTTWMINGNDFGSNYTSNWYVYGDANTASTFSGGTTTAAANIYESSGSPRWSWHGNYPSTLSGWQSLISPADSAATGSGGNASSACTLPTIPNVT